MKRKIYSKIAEWKERWQGTTALLIDGARRIGKSWIVEEFAKNEYKTYILIDFNNPRDGVTDLFEHSLTDLDSFFVSLSVIYGKRLYKRNSVIIFDEVQMYPKARAALKYLVKDGRYDYIETGSLVSINHNVQDIVIPSEEVRIDMYPMDFEEFMWASGKDMLFEYARKQFGSLKPMGQALHRQMMEAFRTYILVGGMPQAVLAYLREGDFRDADAVKRNIISLYRNDIIKYAGRQAPNVTMIFDNIPGSLQHHEKRFRPSRLKKRARMREFQEAMFWLDESRVANFCYAATEPSVGLALNRDDSKVKIYLADTGLLVSMAFDEADLDQGGIYTKIMKGKLEFNKGMIVENIVAQMFKASGHELYFFSSYSKDDSADTMEIDFLLRKGPVTSRHNICPIEVKSATKYQFTSLEKFERKFNKYLGKSYVLHTGDIAESNGVTFLPIYMAGFL